MELLTQRYFDKISGIISCYDRVVIQGTLKIFSYAAGMTGYLKSKNIRIFDYTCFAEPLRDEIRRNAERTAQENGLEIEFIRKKDFRKEDRIAEILKKRGGHPGLVHIFSAMEACSSYKPWHNKQTHQTYLKPAQGKCLHYYFYFIDQELGLCYLRVPTWCPFRLQFYFNGHNRLAYHLKEQGINFTLIDNAFVEIDDFAQAQRLNDSLKVETVHKKLEHYAELFCPLIKRLKLHYHWSIMQAEYATDIIFKRREDLQAIYGNLIRTAIHTVKPDNIATFLGRKLHAKYQGEMGSYFNTRIEGTKIKHSMGPVSIKMYDKFGLILRIEGTVNDASFFKHYRKVEHRDGTDSMKLAPLKKGIYSLSLLSELLLAANHRYLHFISAFDDVSLGIGKLNKVSKTVAQNDRSYKGFNFFSEDDQLLFETIARGEFNISGFQNKHLRKRLPGKTSAQISRILKRLHAHGLIKKIGCTYKYYLSKLGLQVITMGLKLKELFIIPNLAVSI
ncbi:MAG: MarR family transcriptional regulator [FCB group bacterium]|nr:MarR family transcriptional regulator [FCB group bacterium]